MTDRRFMVVTQQIVGNPESWSTDYSSDLETFTDRQAAFCHGVNVLGHDDFNIATVDADGNLIAFGFDHIDWPNPTEDYDAVEIASQLGLPASLARLEPEVCTEPPWPGVIGCDVRDDRLHVCRAAAGTHRVHECVCGIQRYVPAEATS